jgi:hypothetical protein
MPTQSPQHRSSSSDVWLSSAEVRAWLSISHEGLDELVACGVLKSTPSCHGFQAIFRASDVAKIAAERSQRVTA